MTRRGTRIALSSVLVGTLGTLTSLPASADSMPEGRTAIENIVALRYNPLGLANLFEGGYQLRLYESDARALEQNYVAPTLNVSLTPTNTLVGGGVTLQPASVFRTFARAQWSAHFGNFDRLQSFETPAAPYDDASLRRGGDQGLNYPARGWELFLGAELRLQIDAIAARSVLTFTRPDLDLRQGDTVFYQSTLDLLLPNRGWGYSVDTDVIWFGHGWFSAGVRHTYSRALFPARLTRGVAESALSANHRLGPLLAWHLDRDTSRRASLDDPTLVLIMNFYAEHRYRAGTESSRAVPYVVLAYVHKASWL